MGNEDQGWVAHIFAPDDYALRGWAWCSIRRGSGRRIFVRTRGNAAHRRPSVHCAQRNPETSVDGIRRAATLTERGVIDPSMLYTHQFVIDALSEAFKFLESRLEGLLKAWIRTAA